ncbi:hypothetical protein [Peribacillus loiseleuriae]|uniref:hypothetical protein n=1 Tax=Peribacillus loiseleuriae TaxID=1679170 RepID=UPI003D054505
MNTFYTYRNVVETHIIPYFGIQKIKNITPFMVETFYKKERQNGFSCKTISLFHIIPKMIFSDAKRWGIIQKDIMVDVSPPVLDKLET